MWPGGSFGLSLEWPTVGVILSAITFGANAAAGPTLLQSNDYLSLCTRSPSSQRDQFLIHQPIYLQRKKFEKSGNCSISRHFTKLPVAGSLVLGPTTMRHNGFRSFGPGEICFAGILGLGRSARYRVSRDTYLRIVGNGVQASTRLHAFFL